MGWRRRGSAGIADIRQTGQAGALLQKVFRRELGEPVILPPHRFFFPTVPVEDMGQCPASLLLLIPLFRVQRNIAAQAFDQLVYLDLPVADPFGRRTVAGHRAGDFHTVGDKLGPQPFQPVPKGSGRAAVVLVVFEHRGFGLFRDRGSVVELEICLKSCQGKVCFVQGYFPFKPIERLQPLDGVALHTRTNAATYDLV